MNYLTETEVSNLFGTILSPRDRAMFRVIYWRGLRASEARLITRSTIDLKAGRIHIQRLKNSFGGQHDLHPDEIRDLSAWLAHKKCPQGTDEPIFNLLRNQVFLLFRKYAREAGIPPAKQHPHVLKHSIATNLLDSGLDILDVQDWLGHRAIKNTLVYAEVTNQRRRAAALKAYKGAR